MRDRQTSAAVPLLASGPEAYTARLAAWWNQRLWSAQYWWARQHWDFAARQLAGRRRRRASIDDLMFYALNDRSVLGLLTEFGVDGKALRRHLKNDLKSRPRGEDRSLTKEEQGVTTDAVSRAVHRATWRACLPPHIARWTSARDVFLAALEQDGDSATMRWLHQHNVSRTELFYYDAHRARFDDRDVTHPTEANVELVMWNDGFTSTDFVIEMLISVLRYEKTAAVDTMWRVHNEGSAVVWTGAARDALERAQQIETAAKDAEMPLRLELRELC